MTTSKVIKSILRWFGGGTCFFLTFSQAISQNIPVSFPLVNEYLRREQVIGEKGTDLSFNYRPISLKKSLDSAAFFKEDSVLNRFGKPLTKKNSPLQLSLLPLQATQVYNAAYPYGWGEGPILPARGFQHLLEMGFHASLGIISVQVYPQFFHAQNLPFQEYDENLPIDYFWAISRFVSQIDRPLRHGTQPINQFFPGNSHIKLNFGSFAAGISSENIWWGPGKNHALLLSDNAAGFPHLTLNTTRPAKTFIGSWEGQYFMGKLDGSGHTFFSDGAYQNLFAPYEDDWRYITGISLSYAPKWLEGLSLGFSRSFMMYSEHLKAGGFETWFPIAEGLQKEKIGLEESHFSETDQHFSVFFRWVFPKAKAEVYTEFLRTDHALNWRELLLNPEHSRGYILGFGKYFSLPDGDLLSVQLEMTQTENSINNLVKWGERRSSYHSGLGLYENFQVRHGLTHRGQILGSGLGHSGNLAKIEVSKIKGLNKMGFTLERWARDTHFHNFPQANGGDVLRWVDLSLGGIYDRQYHNLLFSINAKLIQGHNYNYAIQTSNSLGDYGNKKMNFHSRIKMAYLF